MSLRRTLLRSLALALFLGCTHCAWADDVLVTSAVTKEGTTIPYVLNAASASPKYVFILFPGGNGVVDPHMEGDKLVYGKRSNFLLRARPFFVDAEFATVSTTSTQSEERIQALIDDLSMRFPKAKIYLMGTSRGTFDTMALAPYLSTRIAGEIHTSSINRIASFDGKRFHNRHLVVHHVNDSCHVTGFNAAKASHTRYGTDFIAMEGGISEDDPCEAFAYHGYNGIERETADAIKRWVKQGD